MKPHESIIVRPSFPTATTDTVGRDVPIGWQLRAGDVEKGVLEYYFQQNT